MSISLRILKALELEFPASDVVLNEPVPINVEQWRRVRERAADPEVAHVLDSFPETITRNDIIGLRHKDSGIQRRQVAIASLMWGYGITGARWTERWVSAISGLLRRSDLDAVLACCERHLAAGEVAEAYKLFTDTGEDGGIEEGKYHGIGSSFFTKILYFLARNTQQDSSAQYPLILDTKVSMALSWMTGYRLLARPSGYRPRPDSESYARYVKTMHEWAARLHVLPEVIEYYLWHEAKAGKHPPRLWAECKAQHQQDWP
jgi:hypothetical protein